MCAPGLDQVLFLRLVKPYTLGERRWSTVCCKWEWMVQLVASKTTSGSGVTATGVPPFGLPTYLWKQRRALQPMRMTHTWTKT